MHTVSVTISNQYKDSGFDDNSVVQIPHEGVLFTELASAGFELASGCLAGSCGVCQAFIIENEENLKAPSAVEQDTITHLKQRYLDVFGTDAPHPIRLLCRAKVIGDIKIAPFVIRK